MWSILLDLLNIFTSSFDFLISFAHLCKEDSFHFYTPWLFSPSSVTLSFLVFFCLSHACSLTTTLHFFSNLLYKPCAIYLSWDSFFSILPYHSLFLLFSHFSLLPFFSLPFYFSAWWRDQFPKRRPHPISLLVSLVFRPLFFFGCPLRPLIFSIFTPRHLRSFQFFNTLIEGKT